VSHIPHIQTHPPVPPMVLWGACMYVH